MGRRYIQMVFASLVCAAACAGADGALEPVRVCDVVADPGAYDGKTLPVVGRFSFRENGRLVGEDICDAKLSAGQFSWPAEFRITFDTKTGPKAPPVFVLDEKILANKLKAVKQHTSLGTFRFGSLEWDGWAVVYGRVEFRHDLKEPPRNASVTKKNMVDLAPAQMICRGDAMILFVREE